MAGFVPVSHGLFAECYSKGGQLSHGCGHGKGWESPFAFQTVGCFQLHIKKKKKRQQEATCDKGQLLVGCGGEWVWKDRDGQNKVLTAFDRE